MLTTKKELLSIIKEHGCGGFPMERPLRGTSTIVNIRTTDPHDVVHLSTHRTMRSAERARRKYVKWWQESVPMAEPPDEDDDDWDEDDYDRDLREDALPKDYSAKHPRPKVKDWAEWYHGSTGCTEEVLLDEVLLAFDGPYPASLEWLHDMVKSIVS